MCLQVSFAVFSLLLYDVVIQNSDTAVCVLFAVCAYYIYIKNIIMYTIYSIICSILYIMYLYIPFCDSVILLH